MSNPSTMGGGLLKYKILIEAMDMASGRLARVRDVLRDVQQMSSKGMKLHRPEIHGLINNYQHLAKVANDYSTAVIKTVHAQGDLGKAMARGMQEQRRTSFQEMYNFEQKLGLVSGKPSDPKFRHREMGFMAKTLRQAQESMYDSFQKKHRMEGVPLFQKDPQGHMVPSASRYLFAKTIGLAGTPGDKGSTKSLAKAEADLKQIYDLPKRFMPGFREAVAGAKTGMEFMQKTSQYMQQSFPGLSEKAHQTMTQGVMSRYSMDGKFMGDMSANELEALREVVQKPFMKTHAEQVEEAAGKYALFQQKLSDYKIQLQGIATVMFQFAKNLKAVLETTRQLASAQVFTGGKFGWQGVLSQTSMGITAQDTGLLWQSIARSPYQEELISASKGVLAYSKIFNKPVEQFVPTLVGLHTIFDEPGLSMNQRMMMMMGTSAKSSLDFAQWFSRFMQGGVPALAYSGSNMGQTLGIIGALSNVGLAPYASFGVAEAINSMSNPSKKSSAWQQKLGVNLSESLAHEGVLPTLENIRGALDSLGQEDRLKAIHDIFGGRSTGVVQVMMKTTDHARALSRQLNSVTESYRIMIEEQNQGLRILDQTSAAWQNMFTGFSRYYTQRHFFRGLTRTFREIPDMINPWLEGAQGSHRTLTGEIASALPLAAGAALIPRFISGWAHAFIGSKSSFHDTQALNLRNPQMIAQMQARGIGQGQINQRLALHEAKSQQWGLYGGRAVKALGWTAAVVGLYTVAKTISNTVHSWKKDVEKEKYFDPIAALSIADFRLTDERDREDLHIAIKKATEAVTRNTFSVDKNSRVFSVSIPRDMQHRAHRHIDLFYSSSAVIAGGGF